MLDRDEKIIDYLVVIVSEFADENKLTGREAFARLMDCGGIDALVENYDVEHTLPISSTLDALAALCSRKAVTA